MKTLNRDEVNLRKHLIIKDIHDGKVFVYPTDTIYGMGCDATNESAVKRIRDLKGRQTTPFSIIAPSKDWIHQHCHITEDAKRWLLKLPGAYTLIFRVKDKDSIADSVNPGLPTIGIRIPDHWVSQLAADSGKPIITTSANRMGQDFMTSEEDLDKELSAGIDFMIYEGEISGRPSQIVDLTGDSPEIKVR